MFTNLFFILLVLALINFASDLGPSIWIVSPEQAFLWGMAVYLCLLGLLYVQAKWIAKVSSLRLQAFFSCLANVELVIFLGVYHLVLGAQRLLVKGLFSDFQTPVAAFSLFLYLFGLGWAYLCNAHVVQRYSIHASLRQTGNHLLFLLPFCIPFLLFSFIFDLLDHMPFWHQWMLPSDSLSHLLFLIGISLILLVICLALMPFLIVRCWKCKPLKSQPLTTRLEAVCQSLGFKYAGMCTWSILRHSFTAGIIGIFSFSRYIMFTPLLLSHFKQEEIEAILIHEIGHNHYKHLLIYPFILMGMMLVSAALLLPLENFLSPYLTAPSLLISLENGQILLIVTLFVCYALLLGTYFRLVFGFFSRLFERQADLYIFNTTLSPHYMIQALDHIGVVTGNTHDHPSWHHFSIQERINFLHSALSSPHLIAAHHRKVKCWVWAYFLALALGSFSLFYFA
ncbi:M48 family metallopeptidase [Candidatus Protochlamydia phocaeensis]|uniref:M48 family metallopeptidase n=1 Tax=Candidatus Protochlamydia phocaeensis TaxID=1414722 RepID=UPI0008394271|nr:M48 family metallopeptidase [Candidatus Protochlamydia phocaeensis]